MLIPLRLGPLLGALAPPLCWSCGASSPPREPLCRPCRARLRFLVPEPVEQAGVRLWAAVAYEGPARDLVRGLKYRGAAGLADALAAQLAASLPTARVTNPGAGDMVHATDSLLSVAASLAPGSPLPANAPPALVPVPIAPARARRRGYNQAHLLAAALARRTGIPVADCLERRRTGAPQVGRSRQARLRGLAGSIAVRPAAAVPSRALLVDDVVTTGATLAACAEALRQAGCDDLSAVAYARALGR